jgi:cob(I)alamin adenosyltransferase
MSIATGKGDDGTTALLFGRRVGKDHPRVEAYGTVDELSASLGWLSLSPDLKPEDVETIQIIQLALIKLMTELATDPADWDRAKGKYRFLEQADVEIINTRIRQLEAEGTPFTNFEIPGSSERNARAHLARCVCRRSERRLQHLSSIDEPCRSLLQVYLNRLSDLLWLFGREK